MIIFNTFTNAQHIKSLPDIDILMWLTSLIQYKNLGYRLKLYCLPSDIQFLKDEHLYGLYDEIDTEFFVRNTVLDKINGEKFWSSRKIEAIHHELCELKSGAIYSDTDILMFKPLDLNCDALVWSPELVYNKQKTIYVSWDNISKPKDYVMPQYIKDCSDAYNCGILWFKDPEIFKEYRQQYLDFVLDNPCELKNTPEYDNNIFACNAEQRILKAVLTKKEANVGKIMPEKRFGLSMNGNHYYWFRTCWRYNPVLNLNFVDSSGYQQVVEAYKVMNNFIDMALKIIGVYSNVIYVSTLNKSLFSKFYFLRNKNSQGLSIINYK